MRREPGRSGEPGRIGPTLSVLAFIALTYSGVACRTSDEPPTPPRATKESAVVPASTRAATVAAAPRKPPSTYPAGTSCSAAGCHESFRQASFVHAPVAADACGACHSATPEKGHHFPLIRAGNETCTFCHAVLTGKSHAHQVAVSGKCTLCHDPHAAPHKFLFREPVADRCHSCHPQQHHKFDHGPFATGACNACHAAHESDNAKLTIGAGAENCFRCHASMKTRLAAATTRHGPVDQGCNACHEPHTADFPHLLKSERNALCLQCHTDVAAAVRSAAERHGALFVEQGCGNCHDAHASEQPDLLKDRIAALCLACHDKPQKAEDGYVVRSVKAEITGSAFLHGPIREGQCQACHQVHGSSNKRLLAKYFPQDFYKKFDAANYALCFSCHEKAMVMDQQTTTLTGFRNGDSNLHYLHVRGEKGRSCKACHEIHGSNLPKHMASSVPFDTGGWSMPMGFQKMPTGGSCAPGCHQAYQYDRDRPVAYPAKQESTP